MKYKKNLNVKNQSKLSITHSSISELKTEEKNKEVFNILNNKQFFSKIKNENDNNSSISPKNKDKNLKENDLLNIFKKEKDRIIKHNTSKEKDNYLYGNYIKISKPYKCGNVYCFCYVENFSLFTIGPQYYYAIILFIFNNIIFFSFIKYICKKFNILFKILGILIFIILILSQLYTTFINEGIPKRKWFLSNLIINYLIEDEQFYNEFNTNKYQLCRRCNILIDKSLKIVHCDICNICCEFYDHHCPWVGKCIGKNNIFTFKIFVFSNIIFILYNLILFIKILINIFN